ncbi:MAG: hypothetical protein ACW99Q_15960 [Candidatus Kariarchaeaceae archaeon]|jgi:hypothetical protein
MEKDQEKGQKIGKVFINHKKATKNLCYEAKVLVHHTNDLKQLLKSFKLNIDQNTIVEKRMDLNLILPTARQKCILNELCRELTAILPFNDFIIRGFILRAIKSWQLDSNKPIAEIVNLTKQKQLIIWSEVLEYTIPNINLALRIPDKKLKELFLYDYFRIAIEFIEEFLIVDEIFVNSEESLETEFPISENLTYY